ncbi:hypothetical protein ACFLUH_01115, partial [Chloroflexota bacterium]
LILAVPLLVLIIGGIDYWFLNTVESQIISAVLVITLNIVFSIAAWRWKKWGIWSLGAITLLTAAMVIQIYYLFMFSAIGIVGFIFLVKLVLPVWRHFTWR